MIPVETEFNRQDQNAAWKCWEDGPVVHSLAWLPTSRGPKPKCCKENVTMAIFPRGPPGEEDFPEMPGRHANFLSEHCHCAPALASPTGEGERRGRKHAHCVPAGACHGPRLPGKPREDMQACRGQHVGWALVPTLSISGLMATLLSALPVASVTFK